MVLSTVRYFRFNYLTLQVDSIVLNHFVRLIRNLSHLQALELYIRGETEEVWTDESFEVIFRNHASHSFPIFALFEKLTLSGRLQYFDTSEVLFPEQICQALIRCKDLTGIFCAQTKLRKKQWIDLLLVTLEKIHQGEKLPATADDERILHTNYGNDINIDLPHHPWVRFYKNCEQFPSSRVQEHIRLGGVSNKPNC
uniref:Uncharacterized protein n=1 Tax=Ditylenchus dipsaci TaxID=166011 RepID=A0A915CUC7_9BILA